MTENDKPIDGGELPEVVVTPSQKSKNDDPIDGGELPEIVVTPTSNAPTYDYSYMPVNDTDPKVCHDPGISHKPIATLYTGQNNELALGDADLGDDDIVTSNNEHDSLKIDAKHYPLVVINNRLINNTEIEKFILDYTGFLPRLELTIYDKYEEEQKLNSTKMSGTIRVVIAPTVDKVYKNIHLEFRILDVRINPLEQTKVTYYAEYDVEPLRKINIGHISMEYYCPAINCQHAGLINANMWELLHEIAVRNSLGFAATDQTKNIEDRLLRNIHTERFGQYIEDQLKHSGKDEESIFDAWIDLYDYIVLVNVYWVLNRNVAPKDLQIKSMIGISGTTNDTPKQEAKECIRTLTNYNLQGTISNLDIESYSMKINNDTIVHGSFEKIYTINFEGTGTKFDIIDIQTEENSIDGKYIEEYNTGKERPIPRFNFNEGGYDLHTQETIRNAFFRKYRQNILEVSLKNINLGLQRGTLINVLIYDNSPYTKDVLLTQTKNIKGAEDDIDQDHMPLPDYYAREKILTEGEHYVPNGKLSGMYYIDGMKFTYSYNQSKITQILYLIKKGFITSYQSEHLPPKVDINNPKW